MANEQQQKHEHDPDHAHNNNNTNYMSSIYEDDLHWQVMDQHPAAANMSDDAAMHEEQSHFNAVVDAFRYYETHALDRIRRMEHNFYSLPEKHRARVPGWAEKVTRMKQCVSANQAVIDQLVSPFSVPCALSMLTCC